MLVLSRKLNQTVQIGSTIQITVISIRKGQVRLGFDAPENVCILRTELLIDESVVDVPVEGRWPQKAK